MRKIILLIAAAAATLSVSAQNLPLLLIDTDARQAALCCPGEAGRQDVDTFHAEIGYGLWSSSEKSTLLSARAGYKLPMGLYVGLAANMMKDSPYEIANAQGMVTGRYAPYDAAFGLFADYGFTDFLKAGLRARYIMSSLGQYSNASAFGADVYCVYTQKSLKAALEFCNLGTGINYGHGAYSQPALVRASASYNPLEGLLVAADVDYLFSGALMAGLGAEYTFAKLISIRAGYHYGSSPKATTSAGSAAGAAAATGSATLATVTAIPSYASVGLGATFKGVSLNASALFSRSLTGTFLLRAGYSF